MVIFTIKTCFRWRLPLLVYNSPAASYGEWVTEIPDADLAEQVAPADPAEAEPAGPEQPAGLPEIDDDTLRNANEADAVEQRIAVPDSDDDYR
jgi:hypothetical protein